MRKLTAAEVDKVHGGMALRQAVSSGLHPDIGGGGPGGPPSPVRGLPPDNSWVVTPVHNNLGQVIGQNLNMGDAGDLITTTESDTFKTSFGNVDYTLMHELGTSDNSISGTQNINGTPVNATLGYDTNNGLFGGGQINYGGGSASLEFNSSGNLIGSGSYNVGGATFTASDNITTGTFTLSGSGAFGDCTFEWDIFGLGSSGGGGGGSITCTGKPTIQPNAAGDRVDHLQSNEHVSSDRTVAVA